MKESKYDESAIIRRLKEEIAERTEIRLCALHHHTFIEYNLLMYIMWGESFTERMQRLQYEADA